MVVAKQRWGMALVAIGVLFALVTAPAHADEAANREYQVKAAMLVNFAQFAEWPGDAFISASAPLVIGVVGANPFGDALNQIVAGKNIGGRPLTVRYFETPERIETCHMLFVPRSEDGKLSRIMEKVSGRAVLTVGETDAFPWAGGIIRFFSEDNKVRFEINPAAADAQRVKISSKLLKLARIFKK